MATHTERFDAVLRAAGYRYDAGFGSAKYL
jgi:hypothetical protein